jgi:hypothetical protein
MVGHPRAGARANVSLSSFGVVFQLSVGTAEIHHRVPQIGRTPVARVSRADKGLINFLLYPNTRSGVHQESGELAEEN